MQCPMALTRYQSMLLFGTEASLTQPSIAILSAKDILCEPQELAPGFGCREKKLG